jgi:hypothetical protein
MEPQKFQLINETLQDKRRLIAAGKIQRWEVVKWAVTLNVGLATASLVTAARPAMFFLCLAVSVVSIGLIYYYNSGMTDTRRVAINLKKVLSDEVVDTDALSTEEPYPANPADLKNYDQVECTLFSFIIAFSITPSLLVWALNL